MSELSFRGLIFQEIKRALQENKDLTVGEILYTGLHKTELNGKSLFCASDEEILNSLERLNKGIIMEDEQYTDEEFENWRRHATRKVR